MRIIVIAGTDPRERMGGAEYQAMLIARGLAAAAHEVMFLATHSKYETNSTSGRLSIRNIQNWKMTGLEQYRQVLRDTIQGFSPDLCYVRRFKDIRFLAPICEELGLDFVSASSHLSETNPFLRTRFIGEMLAHMYAFLSIRSSRMHICNTKTLQNRLQRWYPRHPIRTIYNGQPVPSNVINKNGSARQIVWVNNLKPWKRPELFLDLAGKLPQFSFVMVGRIPENRFGARFTRSLRFAPRNLDFVGSKPIDDVNRMIGESDLLVYTSRPMEGFANSFLQAWLRGVPTLSLEYPLDGIIEREGLGRCSKNFHQMVSDVEELMNDHDLRRRMGDRAREYAVKNHGLDRMISKYESAFEEAIATI